MFESLLSLIPEVVLESIFIPIFRPEFNLEASTKFNWFHFLLTLAVSGLFAGAGIWLLLQLLTDSLNPVSLFGGLLLLASGSIPAGRAVIDFMDYRRQRLAKIEAEKPYQEL